MKFAELMGYIDHVLNFKLFQIRQTPVTVSSLFIFLLVMMTFFILLRILRRIFLKRIMDRMRLEEGTQYNLKRITHYLVMLTGHWWHFSLSGLI